MSELEAKNCGNTQRGNPLPDHVKNGYTKLIVGIAG